VGFRPLRRLKVGESTNTGLPSPAVVPLVPFPRLQRLAPRSTVPGLSPGNAHGVWGVCKGFPTRGWVAVTGFRPSWR
jgi:hypothetical protein